MKNIPKVNVQKTETGIIVITDAGFCEVWSNDDCLGYVKGPGEKEFTLKSGQHEICIYSAGIVIWHDNVCIGQQNENIVLLERLTELRDLLKPLLEEVEEIIKKLKK